MGEDAIQPQEARTSGSKPTGFFARHLHPQPWSRPHAAVIGKRPHTFKIYDQCLIPRTTENGSILSTQTAPNLHPPQRGGGFSPGRREERASPGSPARNPVKQTQRSATPDRAPAASAARPAALLFRYHPSLSSHPSHLRKSSAPALLSANDVAM